MNNCKFWLCLSLVIITLFSAQSWAQTTGRDETEEVSVDDILGNSLQDGAQSGSDEFPDVGRNIRRLPRDVAKPTDAELGLVATESTPVRSQAVLRKQYENVVRLLRDVLSTTELKNQLEQQERTSDTELEYSEPTQETASMSAWRRDSLATKVRREVDRRLQDAVARQALQPFGMDFFTQGRISEQQLSDMPAPSDYILGPGDKLKIIMWTDVGDETVYDVSVSPEGQVYVPTLGVVGVQGQTMAQFEQTVLGLIAAKFKHFKGQVSLTRVRNIQVFVVGEVHQPGAHVLSGVSTLMHALYRAGGPTERGTMRQIKLLRNHKEVAKIDLYDYFLRGNRAHDVPLESGDTVFVGPVGPRVQIQGEALRPATYELCESEKTLTDVIRMAGGSEPNASALRIVVKRWNPTGRRIAHDIPATAAAQFLVKSGDEIVLEPAEGEPGNNVEVDGAVLRPGVYALSSDRPTTTGDVIHRAGGLVLESASGIGQIVRLDAGGTQTLLTFDVKRALAGDTRDNLQLNARDRVHIFANTDVAPDRHKIWIRGAVRRPGEYVARDGMTLRDLIIRAQGLSIDASNEAEIARREGTSSQTKIIRVNIDDAMKNASAPANERLHDFDQVNVLARGDNPIVPENVTLKGEVARPGTFAIERRGMRLSDLIKRAGGLNTVAFPQGAILLRRGDQLLAEQQMQVIERVQKDLYDQADLDLRADLLRAGAKLSEVGANQSTMAVDVSSTLSSTAKSDSGPRLAQRRGATGEVSDVSRQASVGISSPRLWGRKGRVPVDLVAALAKPGTGSDIELRDGDELLVPLRPTTVGVIGAVINPSNIVWREGQSVRYYLGRVGGFSANANHARTVIVRANGEVMPLSRVRRVGLGDVIVVPPKANLVRPTKLQKMQEFGEIAKVLGNLALVYQVMENTN